MILILSSILYGYFGGKILDDVNNMKTNYQESFAEDKLTLMLYDVFVTDDINFEPTEEMFKPLTYHCSGAIYEMTVGNPMFEKGLHLITDCEPNNNVMSDEVDIISRAWDKALHSFSSVKELKN